MANDDKGLSIPAVIAYTIAGMALAASFVLAYHVTHPKRLLESGEPEGGEASADDSTNRY